MELLHVAEQSAHLEIRTVAIQMAKDTLRHKQKQTARLSPNLVLWLLVALFLGTISACWYAFLRQPNTAYQLSGISILLFIVISAIILFVSGTLSQSNLMKVFGWAMSYVRAKLGLGHKSHSDGRIQLQASADNDETSPEK
jgi:site-specific recombinase